MYLNEQWDRVNLKYMYVYHGLTVSKLKKLHKDVLTRISFYIQYMYMYLQRHFLQDER